MSRDGVRRSIADAPEVKAEPPRPLIRDLPPADPYPIDALGDVLAAAARAIHDRVQAPFAICGQSVLAAATLTRPIGQLPQTMGMGDLPRQEPTSGPTARDRI
jgi:hypothetical protein